MYRIEMDKAGGVVEVTLGGLMPVEEVTAYILDLKRALIINALDSYAMVIDVSDCPIQSQDMIKAMGEAMASMPKARALAIVTGSALARMQIRRLFTQPYARIAATVPDGRAWVLSGAEPPT